MGIPKSSRLCRRHSVSFLGCRRSRVARLDQRGRRCASTAWRAPVGVASRVRAAAGRSPGTRSVRLEAARNPNYCVRVWCGPSMCEGFVVFIGDIGLALLAAMIERAVRFYRYVAFAEDDIGFAVALAIGFYFGNRVGGRGGIRRRIRPWAVVFIVAPAGVSAAGTRTSRKNAQAKDSQDDGGGA